MSSRRTLLLVAATMMACSSAPSFEDSVKKYKTTEESDEPEIRSQVFRLAKAHVQQHEPGCQAQGVAVYPYYGTSWHAVVDCSIGQERRNVHLEVDLFLKDDGALYWKTEYAPPRPGAKPSEFASAALGAR